MKGVGFVHLSIPSFTFIQSFIQFTIVVLSGEPWVHPEGRAWVRVAQTLAIWLPDREHLLSAASAIGAARVWALGHVKHGDLNYTAVAPPTGIERVGLGTNAKSGLACVLVQNFIEGLHI